MYCLEIAVLVKRDPRAREFIIWFKAYALALLATPMIFTKYDIHTLLAKQREAKD